jgi:PD-(D/E)XK nuclease superfamily
MPSELSDAIDTGIKGHQLLQSFYQGLQNGLNKEESKELVHKKAKQMLDSPIFDPKMGDLLKAWSLVSKYITDTEFTNEIAIVENRFLFPLNKFTDDPLLADVQIGFTPDVVFKRKGDFYTVEDSKFIGRAWSQKKLNRFPQAKLYGLFLREMGYNVTRSSIRFFNTTKNEITSHSEGMTLQEPEILVDDFVATVREIVTYKNQISHSKTRRTMNYSNCQYCWFEQPCTQEAQGKDASKTIKYLYKRNDYDYSA